MTLIYVATPYTNYPHGREQAYIDACRAQAHLMHIGLNVFCPIAHTHTAGELLPDADHDFWMAQDSPFIDLCHVLVVVTMDGWKESRGVTEEIARFKKANKPVLYMELPVETKSEGCGG